MMVEPWESIGNETRQYDGWRIVTRKEFIRPDGRKFDAEVFDYNGCKAAAIIALTDDNLVVIARQFRCGPEDVFDELPGGAVEMDEDSETAVRRELEEETGYVAGTVKKLGTIYKHAWMATSWDYYLATNCVPNESGQKLDAQEEIEVELISIEQLIANAKSGKMTDTEAVFLGYDTLKEIMKEGRHE